MQMRARGHGAEAGREVGLDPAMERWHGRSTDGVHHRTTGDADSGVRADPLRALRAALGNRAVQRLVESGAVQRPAETGALQPKLRVGSVDSPAEREADRVADRVVRMPDPLRPGGCVGCGREGGDSDAADRARAGSEGSAVGRRTAATRMTAVAASGRDATASGAGGAASTVRGGGSPGRRDGDALPRALESRLDGLRGGGRPLSDGARSYFEPRFGTSFDDVSVHDSPRADAVTRSLGAEAVTVGSDVFFARGRFDPDSGSGRRLLAHELAHVVQNRRGAGHGSGVARRSAVGWSWWECAKGAGYGAGTGVVGLLEALGGSLWSPIDTIQNAYYGMKEVVGLVLELELGPAAKQAAPKLYALANGWGSLPAFRHCKLIGEVIAEYGGSIVSGGSGIIKKLKALKRSNSRRSRSGGSSGESSGRTDDRADSDSGTDGRRADSPGVRNRPELEGGTSRPSAKGGTSPPESAIPVAAGPMSTPDGPSPSPTAPVSRPKPTMTPAAGTGTGGGVRRGRGGQSGRRGGGGRKRRYRNWIDVPVITPWGRRVTQRTDVDWDLVRSDGLTNREAAAMGKPPRNRKGQTLQLHHANNEASGGLIEAWPSQHRKAHRRGDKRRAKVRKDVQKEFRERYPTLDPNGPRFRDLVEREVQRRDHRWRQDPENRDLIEEFDRERREYWKWRVQALDTPPENYPTVPRGR